MEVFPVPIEALAEVMPHHLVIEDLKTDAENDAYFAAHPNYVGKAAERHGIDEFDLEMRASALTVFLRDNRAFIVRSADGALSAGAELLKHAATTPLTTQSRISWPI